MSLEELRIVLDVIVFWINQPAKPIKVTENRETRQGSTFKNNNAKETLDIYL